MYIEKDNYYYVEEFEKYGVRALYTKKSAGNMSDYCPLEEQTEGIQKENRKKILGESGLHNKQEVMAYQTHSGNICAVDEKTDKYYYGKENNIDGFVTKRTDIAIFTFYADCLPIFVYDKKKEVIGVWHSGWPGSYKEIMRNGLETMKKVYGTDNKDVMMALGIGIQQKSYEVGEEFYERFIKKFGEDSSLIKDSFKKNEKNGKFHFDNTEFNKIMAQNLGIDKKNIIISTEDTFDEKFYSYRREGNKAGRAAAIISFFKKEE